MPTIFGDLAAYWRDYDRLSRFWVERYPSHVRAQSYEALLAEPEAEIRALLDFCGLPFDESCLRFHEAKRGVRTVSSGQVRQPLRRDTARAPALRRPARAAARRAGGGAMSDAASCARHRRQRRHRRRDRAARSRPTAFTCTCTRMRRAIARRLSSMRSARAGGSADAVAFDLVDGDATRAVVEALLADGPIHALVHNAGIHDDAPLAGMREEQWRRVHRHFAARLLPRRRSRCCCRWRACAAGRIVAISSVAAVLGNRGQVNYAAAKSALHGATKSLAREMAFARHHGECRRARRDRGSALGSARSTTRRSRR